jgi:hypothetical protein
MGCSNILWSPCISNLSQLKIVWDDWLAARILKEHSMSRVPFSQWVCEEIRDVRTRGDVNNVIEMLNRVEFKEGLADIIEALKRLRQSRPDLFQTPGEIQVHSDALEGLRVLEKKLRGEIERRIEAIQEGSRRLEQLARGN